MDVLGQIGLELKDGRWYWQGKYYRSAWHNISDSSQLTGKTIIETINAAPEFQKFCAVNGLIELGFTQITKIKTSYGVIELKFVSQFLDREITIRVDSADESVAGFIKVYPKYVAAVAKIAEHEACAAKYDAALAKISALEAEIADLRLCPGGPDYLAAKERFERGYKDTN